MISGQQLRDVVPELDTLSERTMARVARACIERRFAKGATLYRSGDAADGLYIVLAGRVHVSRETTARTTLLHVEGVGGVLGEIPVFGGGAFPATAYAAAATRCAHLPVAAVERLLLDDGEFARFALRRLATRARSLLRRIDELTAMTITVRVADYLLRRVEALGNDVTLGMSQDALAHELGTAREVIVRALRSLVAAGAIGRVGRSRFSVNNLATLRALASR
jgi:CRP/FNR family transcriptional regulator